MVDEDSSADVAGTTRFCWTGVDASGDQGASGSFVISLANEASRARCDRVTARWLRVEPFLLLPMMDGLKFLLEARR